MQPTRKYAKGEANRDAVLEAALEIIADRGYDAPTVRELATAVGLSKTAVAHHIGSKDELLLELIRRRDTPAGERFDDQSADQLLTRMIERLHEHRQVSGLRELYIRLVAEATAKDHIAHEFFRERYERLHGVGTRVFEELKAQDRLPGSADPQAIALLMLAVIDGLELQSFYRPELDLPAAVEGFIELLQTAGGAAQHTEP